MNIYKGKVIYGGIAEGKIVFYSKKRQTVRRTRITDISGELNRLEAAKKSAIKELNSLYNRALQRVGEDNASIFDIHIMLIEDDDYNAAIKDKIENQHINAEYAVARTGDAFAEMFKNMNDEYFKARSTDILDVSSRLVNALMGTAAKNIIDEPCIVVAEDLAPSETMQINKEYLLSFVTKTGSSNSHTAILARTMNLPSLTGIDIQESWDGQYAIVDGCKGELIVNPDEKTIAEYKNIIARDKEKRNLLNKLKGKSTETKSGKKIKLYANIGKPEDLANVLKNDAEGIGLFRSEFLYLGSEDYPTEEEQFWAYKKVAETMANKKVIIRTLDIGADKQVDYFNLDKEENPALGYRAIRICLDRQNIFKTQLRALLRASAFGNISIMYPMIISVDEVIKIKEIVKTVMEELDSQGILYNKKIEQGIMIETPASVIISDKLAEIVDFFSIGTNDLIQYTLAVDRQNDKLDNINNPHHPAILRSIKTVAENGKKAGIWTGICGELAADTELTETFLNYGIDELSVSPTFVLPVRHKIRELP